jgi:serine/threonine-protein kinase
MALKLHLSRDWQLAERIDAGGFGQVFAAKSSDGEQGVVKLVPKAPGADRELLFVELKGVRNIVPIIDRGDAGDNWAIVMPRAEKSLRKYLNEAGRPLNIADCVTILSDIVVALIDLDGKVVHRDLKPENILYLNGHWCLADFGISRYAESSTAPDTRKFALSPPYAAPERWRAERATTATDIYSLGVIAFELVTFTRPFLGPDYEDYRNQHLHADPPVSKVTHAGLSAIVAECLYKAPGARPSPANLLERLQRIGKERTSGGLARLREANLGEVARRSESERIASENRSAAERRAALFKSASQSWTMIRDTLFHAIADAAPSAIQQTGRHGEMSLALGLAQIEFFPLVETAEDPWHWGGRRPAFDVMAHAGIIVRKPRDRYDYEGRSHSLWFCDAREANRYQWFETAFMLTPMTGKSSYVRPFALDPGRDAAKALWVGLSEFQLAWPLEPLTIGDLDDFIDRWANWFALAADDRLSFPSTMPERPTPRNWRER